MQRRSTPRYVANLPARVRPSSEAGELEAKVVNLSVMGCCLDGAGPLKGKQECEITIDWEGRRFQAGAMVTWKSSGGEAGLKFLEIDEESDRLLKTICSNLRLQPLATLPDETV